MRRLIFLGTGAAMATECYNACFLLETPDGEYFLTDAGGGDGILRQMKRAGASFERLRVMFITHAHTDHILGAVWVLRRIALLMNKDIYAGEFHIYAHDVACRSLEMIAQLLLPRAELAQLGTRILLHELRDGEETQFLNMRFTAFDIRSTKAKQFGYRLRFANRHSLVCLGDEPFHEHCRRHAAKADWLISEAFCLEEESDRFNPHGMSHGTVREAAEAAAKLAAKHLILYHTEDTAITERKARYTAEASESFAGPVFVPDDLDVIEID
ncbi:MAG: MBL fold metallo-hydrolase [Schwartzia sp.]|nr:MBL fold metallo-hydrolase [Schwartzia sp. (in: firmicutes)]